MIRKRLSAPRQECSGESNRTLRLHPLADAIGIKLLRFGLMLVTLQVAAAAGVSRWDLGLVTNVVTVLAVTLMTLWGVWHASRFTAAWRSSLAVIAVVPKR